ELPRRRGRILRGSLRSHLRMTAPGRCHRNQACRLLCLVRGTSTEGDAAPRGPFVVAQKKKAAPGGAAFVVVLFFFDACYSNRPAAWASIV
ncbi:hypothetical protein, partial [Rhodoplanes roseus]|uniref:hypothetical protein n=1 Tax=Rhodoplanes roseus TaxID=29409 RepID=UPI001AECEEB9